jgi:hypothetical protein
MFGRWPVRRRQAPVGALIPLDLDAAIVIAPSEKEQVAPTWKKTFGFHPLCSFIDHGHRGPESRPCWCSAGATRGPIPPRTT